MKLKQTIRRILKEEMYLSVYLRRRIGMEGLEEFFNRGINAAINRYRDSRYTGEFSNLNDEQTYNKFENIAIGEMLYHILFHIDIDTLETTQPDIYDDLKNHYKGRIKELWDTLNVV